jgi:sigma-B regulation protein RsbU (phosphoserine phosphatase)
MHTPEQYEKKIESLTRNLLECYEELDLVFRLSRGLMSTLDVEKSVALVLDEAMEIMDADLGCVVPGSGSAGLFGGVHRGVTEVTAARLHEALVRPLLESGASRTFHGLRARFDDPEVPDAFLCSVLKTDSAVYGALCVGRRETGEEFTAGEMKLAKVLVSQAAMAIENEALHRQRLVEQEAMIRIQEELRLARSIQDNLLPKETPVLAGYDIAGKSLPALSVGGDYYDFIPMGDHRLGLALGDVSGKGMPAALLMAHLQAAIRSQMLMESSPASCLGRSNSLLYRSTEAERFATCFFGILDAGAHRLCYTNAGHDTPLLVSRGGRIQKLETGGLVLGILQETRFEESTVPIEAGDLLLIYSDGITEAVNGRDEEFGVDRLAALVAENRERRAREVVERILAEVERHAGAAPPSDDRTLVVIRREPLAV